jgi:hypothetical protein
MPLHIEISGSEMRGAAMVKIARNRQCFEKDFRHEHGASPIEHHAPLMQSRDRPREAPEVPVTGSTDGSAVCRRMLVDDLRAHGSVDCNWDVMSLSRQ